MKRVDQLVLIVENAEPWRDLSLHATEQHGRLYTTGCRDRAAEVLRSQQTDAIRLEPALRTISLPWVIQ